MATPQRFPEFDMSSIRKAPADQTPAGSLHAPPAGYGPGPRAGTSPVPHAAPPPSAAAAPPPSGVSFLGTTSGSGGFGGGSTRDTEQQRFARIVAEKEYRLLEEQGRAHERESKLREELARERAAMAKRVEEEVERRLAAERLNLTGAPATAATSSKSGGVSILASGEMEQLKTQLAETQRLLADAERRYQQEKRELLNLRTNQLKTETNKRGQEGDIIARAMQVMSEYETIVRSSEENSLARLAHHMENFEKEWIRRSREFEERKSEFESAVMSKALEALQVHHQDVDAIGQGLVERTLDMLRVQSDSRLQVEEEVLQHSEEFKLQYKEMLDREFQKRCRLYDEKIAERERNLVKILEQERGKILQAEGAAVAQHESLHLQALTDAMNDVSALREQLVKEHHDQQERLMKDLIAKRNELREEQQEMISHANERVADIEQQCLAAVSKAQAALKDQQVQSMRQEAELTKRLIDADVEHESQRAAAVVEARAAVEVEWKALLTEVRAQHLKEVEQLTSTFHERLDRERAIAYEQESELRKSYEQKLIKVEEAADERWANRVAESTRAVDRHLEVIQVLRDDNDQLSMQLTTANQQFHLRDQELASKVAAMQRESEAGWHRKIEEMRVRYDQLLDEALGGVHGDHVSAAEHEKAMEQIRELEERCVSIKTTEAKRLETVQEHLNELWKSRLDDERAERAVWEQEQLKRLADLRVEVHADARRKETELLRRLEQERLKMHEQQLARTAEDRRDRDGFEDRIREEADTRVRAAEEELNDAYAERVRILERRIEEREVALERRRAEMKREVSEANLKSKQAAAEWLEKEKADILADVKQFHEKLYEEQQRIETDRVAFEQRLSMQYAEDFERAKAGLQEHLRGVTKNLMEFWQQTERDWLQHRADELLLVFEQRTEHERLLQQQTQRLISGVRNEAKGLIQAERSALDIREAQLFEEAEKQRILYEAKSHERALKLLDDRNEIMEQSEKKRAEEEAKLWEALERRILDKERQAEADRRILEMELRNRYETLMASERSRVDALLDTQRSDARELYDKQLQNMRERDEEWHRHRLQIEVEERAKYEQQFAELRELSEKRVQDERRRFEATLRLREQEFDAERSHGLDVLDKQLRDHETATRQQLAALKDDYDRRVRMLMQDSHHQREEYVADLAEQERRFQEQRSEYEEAAAVKFETSLRELRGVLDRRAREQQVRDLELRESLEASRRAFEEKLHQQYVSMLKENESKLGTVHEAHQQRSLELETVHQTQLLSLRQESDQRLSDYFSQQDRLIREAQESNRLQFQSKLEEYYQVVAQERRLRIESETKLSALQAEMESTRLSMEQYKLETHRAMEKKFEVLFSDVRDRSNREKEEQARRVFEEEEKKLALELTRRDADRRGTLSQQRTASSALYAATPRTGSTQPWGADAATPRASGVSLNHSFPTTQSQSTSHPIGLSTLQGGSGGGGVSGGYAARLAAQSTANTAAALAQSSTSFALRDGTTPSGPNSRSGTPTPSGSYGTNQREATTIALSPTVNNNNNHNHSSTSTMTDGSTDALIQKRKDKLQQLWQVLDYPQDDRLAFLQRFVGASPERTLEELNVEIKRLEVQLPLLEVITRREFVTHRLRELDQELAALSTQNSTGMDSQAASNQQQRMKQRQDLQREQQKLTEHLKIAVPKHEQKYDERFYYRGERFLDSLLSGK